jgi:hypothetical protein
VRPGCSLQAQALSESGLLPISRGMLLTGEIVVLQVGQTTVPGGQPRVPPLTPPLLQTRSSSTRSRTISFWSAGFRPTRRKRTGAISRRWRCSSTAGAGASATPPILSSGAGWQTFGPEGTLAAAWLERWGRFERSTYGPFAVA